VADTSPALFYLEDKVDIQDVVKSVMFTLKEEASNTDTEEAHVSADDALCLLLDHLGYGKVVEAYNNIDKWYA
jgi:hypothetical protein